MILLEKLGSLKLVGFDVMEVSPAYDHADITALAGATLAMTMIATWGQSRRKR
jgi:agmatinase